MNSYRFIIEGFHCEACVKIAKMKIGKISGVSNVEVRLNGDAKVSAEREIGVGEINQILLETGYKAKAV